MLCKAFPCRERVFGVRGPGPPLAGLRMWGCSPLARWPRGTRGLRVGLAVSARGTGAEWADRESRSPSRAGAHSGPSAPCGHGELCASCALTPFTGCGHRGAAGRRPQGACSHCSACSVEGICGKTGPDLPLVVESLKNDLECRGKRDPDICLFAPSTAPGPQ